jgi:hypothetical protein
MNVYVIYVHIHVYREWDVLLDDGAKRMYLRGKLAAAVDVRNKRT